MNAYQQNEPEELQHQGSRHSESSQLTTSISENIAQLRTQLVKAHC